MPRRKHFKQIRTMPELAEEISAAAIATREAEADTREAEEKDKMEAVDREMRIAGILEQAFVQHEQDEARLAEMRTWLVDRRAHIARALALIDDQISTYDEMLRVARALPRG